MQTEETTTQLRVLVIAGSVRPGSFSLKTAEIVKAALRTLPDVTVDLVDPLELDLALPGVDGPDTDAERLREAVDAADGLVLVTPEYHGSYSAAMKLVIENLGYPSALAGKPVALVGVATGSIGAIKAIEHLRGVCSHVGAMTLPGDVSIARVHEVFDTDGSCRDDKTRRMLDGAAAALVEYLRRHACGGPPVEEVVRGG